MNFAVLKNILKVVFKVLYNSLLFWVFDIAKTLKLLFDLPKTHFIKASNKWLTSLGL